MKRLRRRLNEWWPFRLLGGARSNERRFQEKGEKADTEMSQAELQEVADAFLAREFRKLGFVPVGESREEDGPDVSAPPPLSAEDRERVKAVAEALLRIDEKPQLNGDPDVLWDLAEALGKKGRCYHSSSESYDDDYPSETLVEKDEPVPLELGMPAYRQVLLPHPSGRLRDVKLTQYEHGITVQVDHLTGLRERRLRCTCFALPGETVNAVVESIARFTDSTGAK